MTRVARAQSRGWAIFFGFLVVLWLLNGHPSINQWNLWTVTALVCLVMEFANRVLQAYTTSVGFIKS